MAWGSVGGVGLAVCSCCSGASQQGVGGLGPPWTVKKFSVAHGMYAAGFLAAVTRGARANNLQFSNYFEPVNEGAIEVLAFSSQLTPVGEVRLNPI